MIVSLRRARWSGSLSGEQHATLDDGTHRYVRARDHHGGRSHDFGVWRQRPGPRGGTLCNRLSSSTHWLSGAEHWLLSAASNHGRLSSPARRCVSASNGHRNAYGGSHGGRNNGHARPSRAVLSKRQYMRSTSMQHAVPEVRIPLPKPRRLRGRRSVHDGRLRAEDARLAVNSDRLSRSWMSVASTED